MSMTNFDHSTLALPQTTLSARENELIYRLHFNPNQSYEKGKRHKFIIRLEIKPNNKFTKEQTDQFSIRFFSFDLFHTENSEELKFFSFRNKRDALIEFECIAKNSGPTQIFINCFHNVFSFHREKHTINII